MTNEISKFPLRIPTKLKEELEKECKKTNKSLNSYIIEILEKHLLEKKAINFQVTTVNESKEPKWSYQDYFDHSIDQIFLHGVKRHATFLGVTENELYLRIFNYLSQELLKNTNPPTQE